MIDPDDATCPRCGDRLPADGPAGLCPRCLSSLPQGDESDDAPPDPSSDAPTHRKPARILAAFVLAALVIGTILCGGAWFWNARRESRLTGAVARNKLGLDLIRRGKPEEAIARLREAIQLNPDFAEAHNILGMALHARGEPAEAIDEFLEAIRLQPRNEEACYNLGCALESLGKLEEAIDAYREAIRLRSDFALAHNNLGTALDRQGMPRSAIVAYLEAIRLRPDFAEAYLGLGTSLNRLGKREEAIDAYRMAIRLRPNFTEAHDSLSWVLVVSPGRPRRDYDEGLVHARKAAELGVNDGNKYHTLALAEYRSRHWTESLAAIERSMALRNGGNAYDWFFRAMAHWQEGDKAEARKWFDKAVGWTVETAPTSVELRRFWGEAAELLGVPGPELRPPEGAGAPEAGGSAG
jgi:tetratricopeptide (TPR) repeat protein